MGIMETAVMKPFEIMDTSRAVINKYVCDYQLIKVETKSQLYSARL